MILTCLLFFLLPLVARSFRCRPASASATSCPCTPYSLRSVPLSPSPSLPVSPYVSSFFGAKHYSTMRDRDRDQQRMLSSPMSTQCTNNGSEIDSNGEEYALLVRENQRLLEENQRLKDELEKMSSERVTWVSKLLVKNSEVDVIRLQTIELREQNKLLQSAIDLLKSEFASLQTSVSNLERWIAKTEARQQYLRLLAAFQDLNAFYQLERNPQTLPNSQSAMAQLRADRTDELHYIYKVDSYPVVCYKLYKLNENLNNIHPDVEIRFKNLGYDTLLTDLKHFLAGHALTDNSNVVGPHIVQAVNYWWDSA